MEKELINIIESSKEFCTILLSLELKYVLKIKLYMYKFQYQNSVIVEINTRVIKTSVWTYISKENISADSLSQFNNNHN